MIPLLKAKNLLMNQRFNSYNVVLNKYQLKGVFNHLNQVNLKKKK